MATPEGIIIDELYQVMEKAVSTTSNLAGA